jgi:hypothetical protein
MSNPQAEHLPLSGTMIGQIVCIYGADQLGLSHLVHTLFSSAEAPGKEMNTFSQARCLIINISAICGLNGIYVCSKLRLRTAAMFND